VPAAQAYEWGHTQPDPPEEHVCEPVDFDDIFRMSSSLTYNSRETRGPAGRGMFSSAHFMMSPTTRAGA
jgi:hypothetical protein